MPFGDAGRRAPGRGHLSVALYSVGELILRCLFRMLYRLRVEGGEHVPRTGAFVLAANHQSMFDPIVCGIAANDRPFTYIARDTLFSFKPFGLLIRALGAVPIERGASDSGAIRTALAELAAGRALLLYPEGTRCQDGRVAECRPGVVLLARRAKVPLVVMVVEGAYDIWPRGQKYPRLRGAIVVRVHAPITPEELKDRLAGGTDAFLEGLRREMETARLESRARLRERTHGAWPPPGVADTPYWSA
jgi:1-acyl-sn-glycerol-3-phosphate acyltransferase